MGATTLTAPSSGSTLSAWVSGQMAAPKASGTARIAQPSSELARSNKLGTCLPLSREAEVYAVLFESAFILLIEGKPSAASTPAQGEGRRVFSFSEWLCGDRCKVITQASECMARQCQDV